MPLNTLSNENCCSPEAGGFAPACGAWWVWSDEGCNAFDPRDRGIPVRVFRLKFPLADPAGASVHLHVTADSRYEIFLNGERMGFGPGKGDVTHQFYDTYVWEEGFREGSNELLVRVVDFSRLISHPPTLGAPTSVMTFRGGFVADGRAVEADGREQPLGTPGAWQVRPDYSLDFQAEEIVHGGFVGLFERWRCAESAGDNSEWKDVTALYPAVRHEDRRDEQAPYGLQPRPVSRLRVSRRAPFSRSNAGDPFRGLTGGSTCELPPGTSLDVVLDAGRLQTGFPVLEFGGGAGAAIRLTYAEALRAPWDAGIATLGKRRSLENVSIGYSDETTGWTYDLRGTLDGYSDMIEPDGRDLLYRPMHWRAFRFVRLRVQTGEHPLTIHSLGFEEVSYPFPAKARFEVGDPFVQALWDRGMRTMDLCCHETFEDCPYYEQLQYAGDSAITSQLALIARGENRLTRQAIRHFAWSRMPDGLIQSRYPSRLPNVIPSWALHWIQIVRDYYLYSGDRDLVAEVLPVMKGVLDWFRDRRDATGLPSRLPYWNTADWCPDWQRGQPPGWDTGPTAVISGQFVQALQQASWLHREAGERGIADLFQSEAADGSEAIRKIFWNPGQLLFQDQPVGSGHTTFSQYGNAWAILAGAMPDAAASARNFLFDPRLARASFFGLSYVAEATCAIGQEEALRDIWRSWEEMVDFGLDTWAEDTSYWRSLCHAWSAHPCLSLIHIAAGVKIIEPGYRVIRVDPHPIGLERLSLDLPTPHGLLRIRWRAEGGRLRELEIKAPPGIQVQSSPACPTA